MLIEDGNIKNIYGDEKKERELNCNHKSHRITLDLWLLFITIISLFIGLLVL